MARRPDDGHARSPSAFRDRLTSGRLLRCFSGSRVGILRLNRRSNLPVPVNTCFARWHCLLPSIKLLMGALHEYGAGAIGTTEVVGQERPRGANPPPSAPVVLAERRRRRVGIGRLAGSRSRTAAGGGTTAPQTIPEIRDSRRIAARTHRCTCVDSDVVRTYAAGWSNRTIPQRRRTGVEHVLTIASGAGAGNLPSEEPLHLSAQMELGSFEDDGFPDLLEGKLHHVPEPLLRNVSAGRKIRVELGGQTYLLTSLDRNGRFQLTKDRSADTFGAG
jgi:hypothetical protein